MSLNERQQTLLRAAADDVKQTAPLLAGYLAQGPQVLRARGVSARSLKGLVPGYRHRGLRHRLRRWFLAGHED